MTNLDRLIAELCSDGVEYKRIDYKLSGAGNMD